MMNKRIGALAVLLTAQVLWAVGQTSDFAVLEKYKSLLKTMDKARAAFQKSDWPRSERELEACLKAVPDHHEANYFKAQLRYREGDFARGLDHMIAAEEGFLRLAVLLQEVRSSKLMKDMDQSQALSELVPELEKGYEQSVCKSTVWIAAKQEAEGKIGELNKDKADQLRAREAALPAEYLYFHGNCLFRLKRFPEAEALYRDAVGNDPAHSSAHNNLINLLYTQKRYEDARAALGQAETNKVQVLPGLKKAVLDALGR